MDFVLKKRRKKPRSLIDRIKCFKNVIYKLFILNYCCLKDIYIYSCDCVCKEIKLICFSNQLRFYKISFFFVKTCKISVFNLTLIQKKELNL